MYSKLPSLGAQTRTLFSKSSLPDTFVHIFMAVGFLFLVIPPLNWDMTKLVSLINDDSFYYLEVARNISSGQGSTFDGMNITNGYHPLWIILVVPIYYFVADNALALRVSLIYQALMILVSFEALYFSLKQWGPSSFFVAILPFTFYLRFTYLYNSVEAPVVILVLALLSMIFLRVGKTGVGAHNSYRDILLLGIGLGFLTLARLDYLFFVFAAIILFAVKMIAEKKLNWHGILTLALLIIPSAIMLGIHFYWNWSNFGHIMTVSSAMKSTFPVIQPRLSHWVARFPEYFLISFTSIVYIVVYVIMVFQPKIPTLSKLYTSYATVADLLFCLCLGTVLHFSFISLYGKWAVRFWYFAGYIVTFIVLGSLVLLVIDAYSSNRWRLNVVFLLGVVIALVSNGWAIYRMQQGILGLQPQAYKAALWVRDNLPPETILGMNDAGTLGYFSDHAVVNLDGVINNYEYQDYLHRGSFFQYLKDQEISYLIETSASNPAVINGSYHCIKFDSYSHLYDVSGGSVEVCKEQEVYRSELLSNGYQNPLIIWNLAR